MTVQLRTPFAMQRAGAFLAQQAGGDQETEDELALLSIEAVGAGSSFEAELLLLAQLEQQQGPLQPKVASAPSNAEAAFLEAIRKGLEAVGINEDEDEDEDENTDDEDDDGEGYYYQSSSANTYYVPEDKLCGVESPASLDLSNTSTASASSGSFAATHAPCVADKLKLERRQVDEDLLMFELEM